MKSFPLTRLYTDKNDSHSYFETIEIPLSLGETPIGHLSAEIPATMVQFRWTAPSYDLNLHNAPRKQYIIMVQGGVEITTSRGEKRVFQADVLERSVLLVEDVDGLGHCSRALDEKGRFSIFIGLEG